MQKNCAPGLPNSLKVFASWQIRPCRDHFFFASISTGLSFSRYVGHGWFNWHPPMQTATRQQRLSRMARFAVSVAIFLILIFVKIDSPFWQKNLFSSLGPASNNDNTLTKRVALMHLRGKTMKLPVFCCCWSYVIFDFIATAVSSSWPDLLSDLKLNCNSQGLRQRML